MKIRFPLSAQIASFLVLQLCFLQVVFFLLINAQFDPAWEDSWIYNPIADKLQGVAWVIGSQMQSLPAASWNGVLDTFGNYYAVKFYVFDSRGRQIAGAPLKLPPAVAAKLVAGYRRPPDPRSVLKLAPSEVDAMIPRHPPGPHMRGRFCVQTSDPNLLWMGIRMHMRPPPDFEKPAPGSGTPPDFRRPPPNLFGTLLVSIDNVWQTRLFRDFAFFLAGLVGVVLLSVLLWWPFVHRVTSSLSELTRATEKMAEGKFDTSFRVRRFDDEIGRLTDAIKLMAQRLNSFVTGQKRFLGDIAHELCSPMARLQVALELLERHSDERQEQAIKDIKEEVEEMTALINELLAFSKAGLRGRELQLDNVALELVLRSLVDKTLPHDMAVLDVAPQLYVKAEPLLLERALSNVLRNCVRYAGNQGPVHITAVRIGQEIVVNIVDSGPGVPAESLSLLGEPFYRPEPSRNRSSGGVGLGLAIVKTCIEACDGSVRLRNVQPHGLDVEIRLRACAKGDSLPDG